MSRCGFESRHAPREHVAQIGRAYARLANPRRRVSQSHATQNGGLSSLSQSNAAGTTFNRKVAGSNPVVLFGARSSTGKSMRPTSRTTCRQVVEEKSEHRSSNAVGTTLSMSHVSTFPRQAAISSPREGEAPAEPRGDRTSSQREIDSLNQWGNWQTRGTFHRIHGSFRQSRGREAVCVGSNPTWFIPRQASEFNVSECCREYMGSYRFNSDPRMRELSITLVADVDLVIRPLPQRFDFIESPSKARCVTSLHRRSK